MIRDIIKEYPFRTIATGQNKAARSVFIVHYRQDIGKKSRSPLHLTQHYPVSKPRQEPARVIQGIGTLLRIFQGDVIMVREGMADKCCLP